MRFRQHQASAHQSTLRLLLLFALVVALLLLAVNAVLALIVKLSLPWASPWPPYFFATNSALVLLFVLGGCWVETSRLSEGGAQVARLAGARPAQVSRGGELGQLERRFANIVQEMTLASGYPAVPAAWVLPQDDAINAFAAGWAPDDAVVAVTRGALERLTRAELQGVVAHEFSHLVHGDARLNMRLVGMVWGLQMIWSLGRSLCATDEHGHYRAGVLLGWGLTAVGWLGWAAGRLLQAAVSRQREFLADASAVKYTRVVDGLGGALRKIADQQAHHAARLKSHHAASLAHLLLAYRSGAGAWRARWHSHPPLAERLARLYGRAMPPLAAGVLALVDDEADEPPGGAVFLAAGRAALPQGLVVPGADTAAAPEAHDHDPLQRPSSFDTAAREREALARIELWHGPGEWRAALLALALDPLAVDTPESEAAWRSATADLAVAATVRREIETLSASARREVLALLLRRQHGAALAQRRQARRALRQRRQAWPASPAAQWQALASGLLVGTRWPPRPCSSAPPSWTEHAPALHAATRLLAASLGATPTQCRAWQQAALQALSEFDVPAPRGSGPGLAPASTVRELHLALRVRRLAPMQAPLLLRAWLQATERCGLAAHAGTLDALHLACLSLALPLPALLSAPSFS